MEKFLGGYYSILFDAEVKEIGVSEVDSMDIWSSIGLLHSEVLKSSNEVLSPL